MPSAMRAVLVVAAFCLAPSGAGALSLYFEASPTPATSFCEEPCFLLAAYLEDPTRQREIQALQFDLRVGGSASVTRLCVPIACDPSPPTSNANIEDPGGNIATVPWNLSATVGASPTAGFDALFVLAADGPFDVAEVQELHDQSVGCTPATTCALQREALARDRIYLGRFRIHWDPGPIVLGVGGITGLAAESVPLPEELLALNGASCSFEVGGGCHAVPEPASAVVSPLLALLLAARVMLARSCRRAAGRERRSG